MTDDIDDVGLYDSDTGASIIADRVVRLTDEPDGTRRSLVFASAKRGPIVQIRTGSLRVHYFLNEDTLDHDAARVGRWLGMDGRRAVEMIREAAPN